MWSELEEYWPAETETSRVLRAVEGEPALNVER